MSLGSSPVNQAPVPVRIERITDARGGTGIRITWSNGDEVSISSKLLRSNCPCAECLAKRGDTSHAKPLSGVTAGRASLRVLTATLDEELNILQVWPIGNYALGVRYGDKHDSGIYPYQLLRELSAQAKDSQ